MYLLSANGTVRTILILLVVWQLLRLWMRWKGQKQGGHERVGWTMGPQRPTGDMRIERVDEPRNQRPDTIVEDADFEEIKDQTDHS